MVTLGRTKKLAFTGLVIVAALFAVVVAARVVSLWNQPKAVANGGVDDRKWLAGAQYLRPSECQRAYGYSPDDRLLGCLRPGYRNPDRPDLRVNRRGFYGDELAVPKPPGVFRIVCLGGSTTEAGYCEALGDLVRDANHGPRTFEIVNGGIVAYDSHAESVRWFHDVLGIDPTTGADRGTGSLEPDLLILYSGWNDFLGCGLFGDDEREALDRFVSTGDERIVQRMKNPWFAENLSWLRSEREAVLARRDASAVRRWRATLGRTDLARGIAGQLGRVDDLERIRLRAQRDDVTFADADQRVGEPSPFDHGIVPARFEENAARVLHDARSRGVATAIGTLANAYGCRPFKTTDCGPTLLGVNDRSAIVRNVMDPAIRELASREGATLVDFRGAIDARPDRCSLFHEDDELHYDEPGRRVFAQIAFDALRAQLPLE